MPLPHDALLGAMLNSVPIAITSVDPAGTILFVNAPAARNLSRPADALVGVSLYDLFEERAAIAARERIRQTIEHRAEQHFEAVVTLPDGSKRWFDSVYCPAFDERGEVFAVQIVALDVTAQRRRDEVPPRDDGLWGMVTDDLSLTTERIRALLAAAPMIIAVHDPDMTIRYINRVLPGTSKSDVIGGAPRAWLADESHRAFEDAFARVREHMELTEFRAAGVSGRTWLIRLVPLLHAGEIQQILSCTVDITEQTRLQAQLAHNQKIESLGTMARGIAHDFNNLLAVIMGDVGLIRRRLASSRDPGAFLDSIESAAQRAADLCEQMLIYAGRDQPSQEPGDLNAVIAEMARLTRAAVNTNIRITYQLADAVPPTRCGRTQLGQVLLNLINNAADAIGDDQGSIAIATDTVVVTEPEDCYVPEPPPPGTYARLRITDTGPGIELDAVPRIFDPFYSTKSAGHGLGLSVVLGILSSHGAAIAVDSRPGEGVSITVLFPAVQRDVAGHVADEAAPAWTHGDGTVLVVDDEPAMLRVTSEVLAEAGYHVLQADDGDAALAAVAEHGATIRAIVLDVTMPGRDGHSTLAALRPSHPTLPVVLSSGKPIEPPARDPFVSLLPKPYDASELTRVVAAAIASRRR